MFDSFPPLQIVGKQPFAFRSTRFETWMNGSMTDSGPLNALMECHVVSTHEGEKLLVSVSPDLHDSIESKMLFDEIVTGADRLQLIVVPEESNVDIPALMMFRMIFGPTRGQKSFSSRDPYCCNLFLQNSTIVKVSFSFANPEKLIELYDDKNLTYQSPATEADGPDIFLDAFQRFRKRLGKLPLTGVYHCSVWDEKDDRLFDRTPVKPGLSADKVELFLLHPPGGRIAISGTDEDLTCGVYDESNRLVLRKNISRISLVHSEMPSVQLDFKTLG